MINVPLKPAELSKGEDLTTADRQVLTPIEIQTLGALAARERLLADAKRQKEDIKEFLGVHSESTVGPSN